MDKATTFIENHVHYVEIFNGKNNGMYMSPEDYHHLVDLARHAVELKSTAYHMWKCDLNVFGRDQNGCSCGLQRILDDYKTTVNNLPDLGGE